MYRTGDQFLACAGFAVNQNCAIGGRNIFDLLKTDSSAGLCPDNLLEGAIGSGRLSVSRLASELFTEDPH